MNESTWVNRLRSELQNAVTARNSGNEGMARVLARRAAGIVAVQYFHSIGTTVEQGSAYEQLKMLAADSSIDDVTRERARHFLVRVTPDFTLPVQTDLIADVRWLAKKLLHLDIK